MFVFSALALLGNLSSGFLVFIKNEGATGLQMTFASLYVKSVKKE